MRSRSHPTGRRPQPHAQLHLPALSAEQALLLVSVLERAIEAIYRAHGEAMVDFTAAEIDSPARRTQLVSASLPDDFPF